MKTLIVIAIFCLCTVQISHAQTDSVTKRKVFHIWIKPIEDGPEKEGVLYEVKDTSLIISKSYLQKERHDGKFDVQELNSRNIDIIELRNRYSKGIGVLIGGLSGIGLGILTAYFITNNQSNDLEKALSNAALAGLSAGLIVSLGFITGSTIGGNRKSISIGGHQELFEYNKSLLNDYSIKNNPGLAYVKAKTFSKLKDKVADVDGNVYHTLALGGQVWMASDLEVTHYCDGSKILGVTQDVLEPGFKYNWFAVQDSRKLCPADWHIPTFKEWSSFLNSLGGQYVAGGSLEADFSTKAKDHHCRWWSSTEQDSDQAQSLYLDNKTIGVMFTNAPKISVISVRCIRDY